MFKCIDILDKSLDAEKAATLSNHPVHIMDGTIQNPSSFIPFCKYYGNFSNINILNHEKVSYPVCNAFQPKILKDQVNLTGVLKIY